MFPAILASSVPSGTLPNLTTMDRELQSAYSRQGSVEVEQQIGERGTISAGYHYLRGERLLMSINQNVPGCVASGANNGCRPNPDYANNSQYSSAGSSVYHGLHVSLLHRPARWRQYRVSYTLAKAKSNVGEFFFSSPIDPFDVSKDWSRADNDQRHRLVVNGTLNTPMEAPRSAVEYLTNGFQVSGMLQAYSALPRNITSGVTTIQGTAGRPIVNGEFIPRNAGVGSDFLSLNLRVSRQFRFGDRVQLEALGEVFNPTNHENVLTRNANFGVSDQPFAGPWTGDRRRRHAIVPDRRSSPFLITPVMTTFRFLALPALICSIAFASPAAVPAAGEFPNVPGRANATPSIAAAGSFVAVAWGASAGGKADVFVAVSRDGGTTFGPAVHVNTVPGEARLNGEMPPRVALGSRSGSSLPEIAVLWTARGAATEIKVARSSNGGRTFEKPMSLQASGAAGDRGWPALALDGSGRLQAIWLDHRNLAAARAARGGASGHKPGAPHDGVAMAQSSSLYHASIDGSSATEREVTKGVCYCCKTALAAGPNGTLFAAWRHVYPGSFRDMAFATSRDGGRSFSTPVRVSEDGWAIDACPDDGPAMAVEPGGTVHLAWPTVIGGDNPRGAIFYASTRDGQIFTKRQQVETLGGPKPSHPQIVVDSRRRVFVAWDELANGRQAAALREVRVDAAGKATLGRIVPLSSAESGIYPALASTGTRVVAVWATGGERSRVQLRAVPLP